MDGHAGEFSLATPVDGHPAGTLVQVTVSAAHPSRLARNFSDHHPVLTNAGALHRRSMTILSTGFSAALASRPLRSSLTAVAPGLGVASFAFAIRYGAAAWTLAPYPF